MLEHRTSGISVVPEFYRLDPDQPLRLRCYLDQLDPLPPGGKVVAIAIGTGALSASRVRVIRRLFPASRLAFVAHSPFALAWQDARTSGGQSTYALFRHFSMPKVRRRSDLARSLATWVAAFGSAPLRIFPSALLDGNPGSLSASLAALARGEAGHPAPPMLLAGSAERWDGLQDGLRATLLRQYGPKVRDFVAQARSVDGRYDWAGIAGGWEDDVRRARIPEEADRTLLVVCGFRPSSHAMSSGQKLAYQRIVDLAQRHRQVDVVCFVNRLDRLDAGSVPETWPPNVGEVLEVPLTAMHRIAGMARWPLLPVFAAARRIAVAPLLSRRYGHHTDFFADFSQGLGALPGRDIGLFAFRQHDVVSRLYERKAEHSRGLRRLANRIEAWRARRWEAGAWGAVLRLETLSTEDAADVAQAHPEIDVFSGGAVSTVRVDAAQRRAALVVPGRLIYWGNMSRSENVDAAVHMSRALLPRIRDRVPEAHLWIVGAHPTAEVLALAGDAVHVTGFVEDPGPVFHSAAAAVAPLRLGSGVKIKVLETVDAGIPTIVSPVAGEGIPRGRLLLEAGNDDEFVDLVCRVLQAG